VKQVITDQAAHFEADLRALFPEWRRAVQLGQGRIPQMIAKRRAVGAAQQLLMRPDLSPGFIRLRDGGRLDLTVERLVLRPEYGSLFSAEQRAVARRKLVESGLPRSELPTEPYA
jgi:hypothetical protein